MPLRRALLLVLALLLVEWTVYERDGLLRLRRRLGQRVARLRLPGLGPRAG